MSRLGKQSETTNWKPPTRQLSRACFGLAVVFYCMGLGEFLFPSQSSRTGVWGWLHVLFFNAFGSHGSAVLLLTGGTVSLIAGFLIYRANQ